MAASDGLTIRESAMKILSALLAVTILGAWPAQAATTMIGDKPAAACAKAAAAQQPGANISSPSNRAALGHCNVALRDKLTAGDRTATLVNRGIINAAMGRADAALADYNDALARAPELSDAYLNRGAALMQLGRHQDAKADFDRALALNTDHAAIAYFNRGMANEKLGVLPAAYHDYRQAQALAPDFKPASIELARFQVAPQQRVAQTRQ
jgi:tetratricopeptide (TPR) repeat protein